MVLPLALLFLYLGAAHPDHYRALLQEDQWAEWSTFLAFGLAFLLNLSNARRAAPKLERLWLLGLGAFCLFVAGEEISWGHRLFAFKPPKLFLEHNYQQEANLHNLLKTILDTRWMVLGIAVGYGALTALRRSRWRSLAPSPALLPGLLCVAALELIYPYKLTGELAELLLGLTFVTDALLRRPNPHFAPSLGAQLAVLLGGWALTLGINRAVYGPSEAAVALTRTELVLLQKDLTAPDALSASLLRKRKVHKRMFTATRKGYLRFGAQSAFLAPDAQGARQEARGYYLDPWNQPYWLIFKRVGQRRFIGVYSFGPNRRRDSRLKGAQPERFFSGDDQGFLIELNR